MLNPEWFLVIPVQVGLLYSRILRCPLQILQRPIHFCTILGSDDGIRLALHLFDGSSGKALTMLVTDSCTYLKSIHVLLVNLLTKPTTGRSSSARTPDS
jgi:hypothetical protein